MSDNPVDMLYEEHRYILKVIEGLKTVDKALEAGQAPDLPLMREIVSFMREFADHCHHAKEEDLLFPALIEHGVPEGGCPIGGLLGDHGRGRKLVGRLAEAIEDYEASPAEALATMRESIEGIVALYPGHIWKEDEMVFPLVDRLFSAEQKQALHEGFCRVEDGKGHDHQHYAAFADSLAERLDTLYS